MIQDGLPLIYVKGGLPKVLKYTLREGPICHGTLQTK